MSITLNRETKQYRVNLGERVICEGFYNGPLNDFDAMEYILLSVYNLMKRGQIK